MRIGLMLGTNPGPDSTIANIIALAQRAESQGFHNLWMANVFGHDAITTMSLVALSTKTIGVGTAVTPSYPRHPSALAQQVITAASASKGRFSLGLGLSHKMVIEDMLGLDYSKPASHMREYLQVLMPLLRGKSVAHRGEQYQVSLQLEVADHQTAPVLLAALGPKMLKLAGSLTDGTTTWMTGPKTLASHIIPSIQAAASEANRPAPRIVAGLPIALTDNIDQARETINKGMEIYGILPSYRSMLDREGAAGPGDVALLGNEKALSARIEQLRDMGVTDFNAFIFPLDSECFERTASFLAKQFC